MINETSCTATVIDNLPHEIAVSLDYKYYIPLVTTAFRDCVGDIIKLCPDISYVRPIGSDICIAALLKEPTTEIAKLCDANYITTPKYEEFAMHINNTTVLVTSDSTTATLICGSEPPRAINIHNYALVNIGCNCALKAKDKLWMPYTLRACETQQEDIKVDLPLNPLFISAFKLAEYAQAGSSLDTWTVKNPLKGQSKSPLTSMEMPGRLVNLHTLAKRIVDNNFDKQNEDSDWGMAAKAVAHQTWHIAVTAIFIGIAIAVMVIIWKKYRAALTVPVTQASPCDVINSYEPFMVTLDL